jgi:uncharacterized protein YecE (DUF72 family)
MSEIRAGMAGWVFEPWRGEFYPKGLTQKDELNYASRHVSAIEINATFRQNQAPKSFIKWAADTPPGFLFSVKGPQFITHIKRLNDIEAPLGNFFASGVLALGARLGPIVWQLPPTLKFDAMKFDAFFSLLPRTADEALAVARKNDGKVKGEPHLDATGVTRVRHALEVRSETFAVPEFVELMRHHNVAHVIADTQDWPYLDVTADFVYGRLQGAPGADRYDESQLDRWAARARAWADGKPMTDGPTIAPPPKAVPRDVELHFVSTDKEHAPGNAMALMRRLGLSPPAG